MNNKAYFHDLLNKFIIEDQTNIIFSFKINQELHLEFLLQHTVFRGEGRLSTLPGI